MSFVAACAAVLGLGYLLGSMPWGLWLGRWFRGVDVREHGSRNLGATNVYRVLGPPLGLATLALDVLKGAAPVWAAAALPLGDAWPREREWLAVLAGGAAVAGHVWTCFAAFRGGKGVATTAGVLLALAPAAFGIFLAVFVVTVAATRYVSLGSTLGALAFVLALGWLAPAGPRSPAFWLGALLALVVIVRHRENLRRVLRGEERRFSLKGGTQP